MNGLKLLQMLSVLFAIIQFSAVALGETNQAIPRFENFKVPTPLPPREEIAVVARPDREPSAAFDRSLRNAAKQGPDFAGQNAIVRWGCGSNCVVMAIVNVRTEKIYRVPFITVGGVYIPSNHVLSYRLGSRLLLVTGSIDDGDENGRCGQYYDIWNKKRLSLIKTVPFPCIVDKQ